MVRRVKDLVPLAESLDELTNWIFPDSKPLPVAEAIRNAQVFEELGPDWVANMFHRLQTKPVGRPNRRRSTIEAFEFMLQSRENSQGKATLRFCNCGGKHKAQCEQALKAGIRSLKKILRKYAPDLVSQYDALHPNRDKKVNG
jgi:hypothetical protein